MKRVGVTPTRLASHRFLFLPRLAAHAPDRICVIAVVVVHVAVVAVEVPRIVAVV